MQFKDFTLLISLCALLCSQASPLADAQQCLGQSTPVRSPPLDPRNQASASQAPDTVPPEDIVQDPWTTLNQAKRLLNEGKPNEALQCARDFISFRPLEPEGYFWQGIALEAQRDFGAALKSYLEGIERANKLSMDCAELHVNAGNVLLKQGQYAQAIEQYRIAQTIDPTLATAPLNLGRALTLAGDPQAALVCFKECENLHFDPQQLAYYKAKALLAAGRTDEAKDEILKLLSRLQPQDKTAQTIKQEFAQLLALPPAASFVAR